MSKKLIFFTNMESDFVGMRQALAGLEHSHTDISPIAIFQIDGTEIWNKRWEQLINGSDFVLSTWMGTGLCCEFLQQSSAFMQQQHKAHYYSIVDKGTDLLDYGLNEQEKTCLEQYLTYGGLANYQQLCLWLLQSFSGINCQFSQPQLIPWSGIYQPRAVKALYLSEYCQDYWRPDWPTVGLIFSREDYIWGRLNWQTALIEKFVAHSCNCIAMFTAGAGAQAQGSPSTFENMQQAFYLNNRLLIDVLINPFVFSFSVTGMLELADLQELGVPILQVCNLYQDYQWWEQSYVGLTPNEVSYAVAMPEFDGVIHSVPVSSNECQTDGTHTRKPIVERLDMLVCKAKKWALLRHLNNADKKVAIVFHNYPPTNSNIGSAACIESIESIRLLLQDLAAAGYNTGPIPASSQEFITNITEHATNDRRFLSDKLLDNADGQLSSSEYNKFFTAQPSTVQAELLRDWGAPPGELFLHKDNLIVPGMLSGNIYITVQPPRGFGDDPGKIYHSPDCAPTHHYLGFYYWLRDVWQADAMIHVGTHGNLEWLPGKGNAMSDTCYPDIATGDMPNIYPYWITCVGEGIQAKRRSAACLISYLSAPMSLAGSYEELAELEKLLEEYCHFQNDCTTDALDKIKKLIRAKAAECNLDEDVPESKSSDFNEYIGQLHAFVTDIKNMQMQTGLHILGEAPIAEELTEYILALTRVDNGDIPSLPKILSRMYGYDYYELLENSSMMDHKLNKTYGMLLDDIRAHAYSAVSIMQQADFAPASISQVLTLPWVELLNSDLQAQLEQVLHYIGRKTAPGLQLTTLERSNILAALDGKYIDPSASGAPTSGGADLLPTGRNFYSIDPRALPTPAAWEIGKQMADDIINKFITTEGHYPESVGIILWATSNLRNHGQCVAEFLYLMGLRPVWQKGSMRVVGLEVIPLSELKRPRIDVTGRISGLFRDSMPASVDWLDAAVNMVACLDEDLELNFVRKHILAEAAELELDGLEKEQAWRQASFRVFGDPPRAHGAGVSDVLESRNWTNIDDLAAVYTRWGAHAYGGTAAGDYLPERFKKRMSQIDITVQNVDHRESSMLSGDDYNNYRGGLVAAVRSYKGSMPHNYVSDSSDRSKLQIRTLDEELKRWFRGEAINPKYIKGMQKHGYKGAGDLATYVAVSYQWDATSDIMEDWMYEKYAQKYALDKQMQDWMKDINPWALHRIAEVLLEAEQRGLWQANEHTKDQLQQLFLEMEGELEGRVDE